MNRNVFFREHTERSAETLDDDLFGNASVMNTPTNKQDRCKWLVCDSRANTSYLNSLEYVHLYKLGVSFFVLAHRNDG